MTGYHQMPLIVQSALPEIRQHLWSLYWIPRVVKASHIVELGVRSGESTRALLAACMDIGAVLHSFDQDGDAYHVQQITEERGIKLDFSLWTCHTSDSVKAAENYGPWTVDVLFVDTLHSLDHTWNEIREWHSKVRGAMIFHDTGIPDEGRNGVLPAMKIFHKYHPQWKMEHWENVAESDTGLGILWRS